MTPFSIAHDFRAPDTATLFRAYFDEEHTLEQDRLTDVVARKVLALHDEGAILRRTTRCVPKRQLPGFLRRLAGGEMFYVEELVWHKADDRLELDITPSMLGGRAHVHMTYRLKQTAPGVIRRSYDGTIEVHVPLIGGRAEKTVLEDMTKSFGIAAACTQEWLDAGNGTAAQAHKG